MAGSKVLCIQPKWVVGSLGLALALVVGGIDYVTGPELSFAIFYLLPISFVVWHAGGAVGLWSALYSAGIWLAAELLWLVSYSHPWIPYWNAGVRLVIFLIVVWLLSNLKRLYENLGKAVEERTASLAGEVEHRKRAENALRALTSRYEAILAEIPDIIMEVDQDRVYTWANEAGLEFFGRDALGKEAAFYFEGEQTTYASVQPLFNGDEDTYYVESWQRRKDGERRLLAWWCHGLKDADGSVIGALSTARDITEQRRSEEQRHKLEAQIQQAQKLESLGVLAGGIAHDFNNLLAAILGNADLALQDLSETSPARPMLQEIEKTTHRAADLCKQMLAYSGKGKFVVRPIRLTELVHEMSHMLEVSISKKAVLRHNLATDLPPIEADATQIRQIVMNLIINASEAIGSKSGVISVATGAMECDRAYLRATQLGEELPEGRYAYVEVADTGCGMDADMVKRIFDPFFTTKFAGRGLGLAAVLGIVRSHKGTIRVYSEPGKGTTFKVLFPASDAKAESLSPGKGDETPWRGAGTVLLADDEETLRTLGKKVWEHLGFNVLLAADGQEALKVYREHAGEVVCVVLDLTMPHMDGEETFAELRRIRPDVRVIMTSGYNEQEVVTRFAGRGLSGFIQKPYNVADVVLVMKQVLP